MCRTRLIHTQHRLSHITSRLSTNNKNTFKSFPIRHSRYYFILIFGMASILHPGDHVEVGEVVTYYNYGVPTLAAFMEDDVDIDETVLLLEMPKLVRVPRHLLIGRIGDNRRRRWRLSKKMIWRIRNFFRL